MIADKNQAIGLYTSKIEKIDKTLGYSLTAKKTKYGWLVTKWYSRNSWVDKTEERRVLFHEQKGKIFEHHKQIGAF